MAALASAMADDHQPDLVVTDIVMPDVEGIGCIRAIKQGKRPPKVIAISGAGRSRGADYLSWARHLGADEVLAKPFRMSELMKMSKSIIANPVQNQSLRDQPNAHPPGGRQRSHGQERELILNAEGHNVSMTASR